MSRDEDGDARYRRTLEQIAVYAEGMVRHHEQQGAGEARSWRVVAYDARRALNPAAPLRPATGEPMDRAPEDQELERLVRRCGFVAYGDTDVALPSDEAHELLARLATELLLWRQSHPNDLFG